MSQRLRKIGGHFTEDSFKPVIKQIEGRGVLVVAVMNSNCKECERIQGFILKLESGLLERLSNLVFMYGYSNIPLDQAGEIIEKAEKEKSRRKDKSKKDQGGKSLGDSHLMDWDAIPEGHGYAIYTGEKEVVFVRNIFDHDEFAASIVDTIRRFSSSIRSLPNLSAKKRFLDQKGTGIIVEIQGTTSSDKIAEMEQEVAKHKDRLKKIPVYFCKGIVQEMSFYKQGKAVVKLKGTNFAKFLKKIPGG